MKFPKEVWIGDSVWRIVFKRKIEPTKGLETLGLMDPSDYTIYIKTGLSFEEKLATLIHELGHCMEHEFNLEIPHALLHKLDVCMARVIIDNFL